LSAILSSKMALSLQLLPLLLLLAAFVCESTTNANADIGKYVNEKVYTMPYKTRLIAPLQDGQTVHAFGSIKANPKRIDFNFHHGSAEMNDDDVPLHVSVRFDEGKIVYNTYKNGNWSTRGEERESNVFRPNGTYDMRIRLIDGKYVIYANRYLLGTFDRRDPISDIDHISITGDLAQLRLFHYGGRQFSTPYASRGEVTPGKRLDISGIPTGDRFNINLQRANRDYALHLSVRYHEAAIVRSASNGTEWGLEEREGTFTLHKKEVFDITIANEIYSYQIFVNQKRFGTFAHRGDPNDVVTLEIDGDVELFTVTINDVDA